MPVGGDEYRIVFIRVIHQVTLGGRQIDDVELLVVTCTRTHAVSHTPILERTARRHPQAAHPVPPRVPPKRKIPVSGNGRAHGGRHDSGPAPL